MIRTLAATGLLALSLGVAHAEPLRLAYGATLATGFETNPLQVADDGPDGFFTRFALDGHVSRTFDRRVALFASGEGRARIYEGSVGAADDYGGLLRAGVGYAPSVLGGKLAVGAGVSHELGRSTFVDRATGLVYEVPGSGGGADVPVPDRFDFDATGAFLNLRYTQNRRLKWFLDTELEHTRYVKDYQVETDLSSLDYRSVVIEPGVKIKLNGVFSLGVSLALSRLDYDERPALDVAGTDVPGIRREYEYVQIRTSVTYDPANRFKVDLGIRADNRDDTYQRFLDYDSLGSQLRVEWARTPTSLVALHAEYTDLDYLHATVIDAADELRESDVLSLAARYQHTLGTGLEWFADLGTEDNTSTDPVFEYRRTWVQTGIRLAR